MRVSNVFFTLFGLLTVVGFLMILVPLTDILTREDVSYVFLACGSILIVSGYVLFRSIQSLTVTEALVSASMAWLIMPAISAVTMQLETKTPISDCFFESMSGFTGTGFTVLVPSTLKKSLLMWRSLMQWTGGTRYSRLRHDSHPLLLRDREGRLRT